jgi:hypothetical protein
LIHLRATEHKKLRSARGSTRGNASGRVSAFQKGAGNPSFSDSESSPNIAHFW